MIFMRRSTRLIGVVVAIFFGMNYGWTHAAIAFIANPSSCPDGLQDEARRSVEELFGDARSSPVFVCLQGPVIGLDVSHGTTRFAPFLPSIVVLGPQGTRLDVAAHEYAHAELSQRTSPLLRSYRVPTWFDEGLAMQLDHRVDYADAALRRYIAAEAADGLRLEALGRPESFFRPGAEGEAHYAFAKCVVGGWLADVGGSGLDAAIDDVSWLSSFPVEAFAPYERACSRA